MLVPCVATHAHPPPHTHTHTQARTVQYNYLKLEFMKLSLVLHAQKPGWDVNNFRSHTVGEHTLRSHKVKVLQFSGIIFWTKIHQNT